VLRLLSSDCQFCGSYFKLIRVLEKFAGSFISKITKLSGIVLLSIWAQV
jgi:hypothetical protein